MRKKRTDIELALSDAQRRIAIRALEEYKTSRASGEPYAGYWGDKALADELALVERTISRLNENDAPPAAVYRCWSIRGELLYVGMSVVPGKRCQQHIDGKSWGHDIVSIDIEWYANGREAENAERAAILYEEPIHNRQDVGPRW